VTARSARATGKDAGEPSPDGGASGPRGPRGTFFFPNAGGEERLIVAFVLLSLTVHATIAVIDKFSLFHKKPVTLEDEWTMDIDLATDVDVTVPPKTALPKAEIAPEPKAQAELLPQVTKTVSVKEDTKKEEAIAEEKAPEKVEPKKDDAKIAPEEKKNEDVKLKTPPEVKDNQIDQKELLKRLALEKLRSEEKTAKKTEAPEKSDLARVIENLNTSKKNDLASATALGKGHVNKYTALLKAAIRRNYSLPEAYNLRGAALKVGILIAVGAGGDLQELEVKEPSGEPAFDEATLAAVRASLPLPKPPEDVAGQSFMLVFTP
jgi:protein TonB